MVPNFSLHWYLLGSFTKKHKLVLLPKSWNLTSLIFVYWLLFFFFFFLFWFWFWFCFFEVSLIALTDNGTLTVKCWLSGLMHGNKAKKQMLFLHSTKQTPDFTVYHQLMATPTENLVTDLDKEPGNSDEPDSNSSLLLVGSIWLSSIIQYLGEEACFFFFSHPGSWL